MADLALTLVEGVGRGLVEISARTPAGETIKIRMAETYVHTDLMWQALRTAAMGTDRRSGALAARRGRTDQEEA